MPHLVIDYTPQLDPQADIGGLCRRLAATLCACRDGAGRAVFPAGGIRVLAYPAAHHAVADGSADFGFIYLNLRLGKGRDAATIGQAGEALVAAAREHLAPLLARQPVGLTLQIDIGAEVFDAKFGNLHAHFSRTP